ANLTAINVAANNPAFISIDGVLFDKNLATLIEFPDGNGATSYVIPNTVAEIGASAFSDTLLTGIAVPDGVTNIAQSAFYQCPDLTNVTLSSHVATIAGLAFAYCPVLAGVYFEGNAPSADPSVFDGDSATAYYLSGTSGWSTNFAGLPTALWTPSPPGVLVFPVATNTAVTKYAAGLATDGTNYLFVFSSGSTNCAQLVSPDGTLSGPQIALSGGAAGLPPQLQVVSGATNYLVVWSDVSITSGVDIFGQFISRTGAKVGPIFPLLKSANGYGFQGIEALACDGTNFLVVWQDTAGANGHSGANASYGQLVTPSGQLSGSEFLVANVGAALPAQGLSVAFGRTNYLAAWQSGYYTGTNLDGHYTTYGAFISPDGVVGPQFAISQTDSPDNNELGGIAFDGTHFLVAWNYNPGAPDMNPIDWRLHGRLVSPNGTFPGDEVALASESSIAWSLAYGGGDYLATWGYHLDTTNTDRDAHFAIFDRAAQPTGQPFGVFTPQMAFTTPLLANVVFDGKRFAAEGMLGTVVIGSTGRFEGVPTAQVYGAFIPANPAPPTLTAVSVTGTQLSLTLTGAPGVTYVIQANTNLAVANWTALVTNSPVNG
ncbi:MAG: leucine-rich repeat protein, partial [Verrucomicrobia bacterium]|nr:leucine-rich repeat protein [Verrucomicrobiota bacterium]